MTKTRDFPWGIIIERREVADREIIKYEDTFLGRTDGEILWHVDGVSFHREGSALIYVGLLIEGVGMNTASRLAYGLIDGFADPPAEEKGD